ncbi:unnamed protein product [Aphis gossypii]|uniref:Uncharacterized protein n=1 Tax=Aphis gossypii TaxID=80765 RepID=A0A9P0JB46_APHGO|nr:unnamed protein product [Aphis gossypii]
MSCPCDLYYDLRSSELNEQLTSWLRSMTDRNEYFVKLLRTKIERRARLANAVNLTSQNAVAETRLALVDNNERAAAASDRAAAELERFADELRKADDESVDVSTAALDAEKERLRAIISLRRTALEKAATDSKAAGDQLCQLQAINDRMKNNYYNSNK